MMHQFCNLPLQSYQSGRMFRTHYTLLNFYHSAKGINEFLFQALNIVCFFEITARFSEKKFKKSGCAIFRSVLEVVSTLKTCFGAS